MVNNLLFYIKNIEKINNLKKLKKIIKLFHNDKNM